MVHGPLAEYDKTPNKLPDFQQPYPPRLPPACLQIDVTQWEAEARWPTDSPNMSLVPKNGGRYWTWTKAILGVGTLPLQKPYPIQLI